MSALREPAEVSPETRAYAASILGFGVSDIAAKLFARDDDETRAKVRELIAAGRRKAAEAH